MALNLDDLAGVVGEAIGEVREFSDPWGMPNLRITGEVLRASHPDWRQWEMDLEAGKPEAVQSRAAVHERLLSPLAPAKAGFRQEKKLSEAEAHRRLVTKVASLENLKIDVVRLRERKEGIASLLLKSLQINGETVVRRGGVEHDLSTPAGRESFLDHRLWQVEKDGQVQDLAVPFYQKKDGQPVLDDDGELVENYLAGWNLGDAVAQLALREAEDLSKFVEVRKADALEPSGSISTGPSGTGWPSPSSDGE